MRRARRLQAVGYTVSSFSARRFEDVCMPSKKTPLHTDRQDQIIAEARHYRDQREKTYRAQALKLYPWICARCGREFSGTKLRELTVHHKDHNHDHNPPDGSNWELLCLYCHDNEHERQLEAARGGSGGGAGARVPPPTQSPLPHLKEPPGEEAPPERAAQHGPSPSAARPGPG